MESLYKDEKLNKYLDQLFDLRKDGVNKVIDLKQAVIATKKNPMIEYDEKPKLLASYAKQIEEAKLVAAKNAEKDKELTKEALAYANKIAKTYIAEVEEKQNAEIKKVKDEYASKVSDIRKKERQESQAQKALPTRKPPSTS